MTTCMNPSLGRLLPDYELHALSEQDTEAFELHVMSCEHCAAELLSFQQFAQYLSQDMEIRADVEKLSRWEGRTSGLWARIRAVLWPDVNLLLRPALPYAACVILLVITFRLEFLTVTPEAKIAYIDEPAIAYRVTMAPISLDTASIISIRLSCDTIIDSVIWKLVHVETAEVVASGVKAMPPSGEFRHEFYPRKFPIGLYSVSLHGRTDPDRKIAERTFRTVD